MVSNIKFLIKDYKRNGNKLFLEPWEKPYKKYRAGNNSQRPKKRKK